MSIPTKFTEEHLDLMLVHRNSVKKLYQMSATKQKLAIGLINAGLMKEDEDQFIHNSEVGDTVLDSTVAHFDKLVPRGIRT